jgi:hypothetical protein
MRLPVCPSAVDSSSGRFQVAANTRMLIKSTKMPTALCLLFGVSMTNLAFCRKPGSVLLGRRGNAHLPFLPLSPPGNRYEFGSSRTVSTLGVFLSRARDDQRPSLFDAALYQFRLHFGFLPNEQIHFRVKCLVAR